MERRRARPQVWVPGAPGVTLDLGCGRRKVAGAIGVDRVMLPGVDVVASFGTAGGGGLPFRFGSAARVYAVHVLEHVEDLVTAMEEIHRVCTPGARVYIAVPYFTCVGAFADPTHRRFFTYDTFAHFAPPPQGQGSSSHQGQGEEPAGSRPWQARRHVWFTQGRYLIRRRRLRFGRLHRLLGIEWWANRLPNLYENFFPYLFPARELEVELKVVETGSSRSAVW